MPRLRWSQAAIEDIARLYDFLEEKSPEAAARAAGAIREGVRVLEKQPQAGRPVEEMALEFREWLIDFGRGAYVVLYHFDGSEVVILAVRHGREAGYV